MKETRFRNIKLIMICLIPLVISECASSDKEYERSQIPEETIAIIHGKTSLYSWITDCSHDAAAWAGQLDKVENADEFPANSAVS